METENIALLIENLLNREVGNVSGCDVVYEGQNAFCLEAENSEVKVKIIIDSETK